MSGRTLCWTITKNLVSVGQIVDQGMQARFTHLGCFIEEEGRVIAQGTKSRVRHRLVAQADKPYQLSTTSRLAIKIGGVRIAQI